MDYQMLTKNGHSFWDMSSMLQKAIRRGDYARAGYAANELFDRYNGYLWRRLLVISAEDCYGAVTQEIIALKQADEAQKEREKISNGRTRCPSVQSRPSTTPAGHQNHFRRGVYVAKIPLPSRPGRRHQ